MVSSKQKTVGIFLGGLVLGGVIASGVWQGKVANVKAEVANTQPALFVVDGVKYTTSMLPADASMTQFSLEDRIFNARRGLDGELALRIALAKDAGIPVDPKKPLPSLSELLHIPTVTEAQAHEYYNQVVSKMGASVFNGQAFDAIKTELMSQMQNQQASQMARAKLDEWQKNKRIVLLGQAPQAPTVPLDLTGFPERGNASAAHTVVEVGDFMCPHCRESNPAVEKVFQAYSSKAHFVYVPFALAPQGLSGVLSKGAYCAWTQSHTSYWTYQESAFQVPWEKMQGKADSWVDTAVGVAKVSNLDVNAFKTCLSSPAAAQFMQKGLDEFGKMPGFEGTPRFFIDGRMVDTDPDTLETVLKTALDQ